MPMVKIDRFSYLGCLLFAALMVTSACEKVIEDKKKDAIISIMTSGSWYVAEFTADSVTTTGEFEGFLFRFRENGTVSGENGIVFSEGSWAGDIGDLTITSHFPLAPQPLPKLNGTWKIRDSGLDFVKAEQVHEGLKTALYLKKQS